MRKMRLYTSLTLQIGKLMALKSVLLLMVCLQGYISEVSSAPSSTSGHCGKPNVNKTYVSCVHGFHPNDHDCQQTSNPTTLRYSLKFDFKKRRFIANLTWDEPYYGKPFLWGYEIHKILLPGFSICRQMLKKTRWYIVDGLIPEQWYRFEVLSLPRYRYNAEKVHPKAQKEVKMPTLCEAEEQSNLSPSFRCRSTEIVKAEQHCENGTIDIEWLKKDRFDEYFLEWKGVPGKSDYDLISKNLTKYTIKNLSNDTEYEVKISLRKHNKHNGVLSKPSNKVKFSCLVPPAKLIVINSCSTNTAKITWKKPKVLNFDSYCIETRKAGEKQWTTTQVSKNKTEYVMKGFKNGVTYEIQLHLQRKKKRSKSSEIHRCFCPENNPPGYFVILVSVGSVGFFIMALVAAFACRLRNKMWRQRFPDSLPPIEPLKPMQEGKVIGPKVLVLHHPGCKYVEHVALYFVTLLRQAGIPAVSYEHEVNKIVDLTPAGYLEEKLQKVEYTITLYSEHSEEFRGDKVDLYRQIVLISSNEAVHPGKSQKHLSCYFHLRGGSKMFGDYSVDTREVVPTALKFSSFKFPKDIPRIITRLTCGQNFIPCADKIISNLSSDLLARIEQFSAAVLLKSHKHCYADDCKQGARVYHTVEESIHGSAMIPSPSSSEYSSDDDCLFEEPLPRHEVKTKPEVLEMEQRRPCNYRRLLSQRSDISEFQSANQSVSSEILDLDSGVSNSLVSENDVLLPSGFNEHNQMPAVKPSSQNGYSVFSHLSAPLGNHYQRIDSVSSEASWPSSNVYQRLISETSNVSVPALSCNVVTNPETKHSNSSPPHIGTSALPVERSGETNLTLCSSAKTECENGFTNKGPWKTNSGCIA